MKSSFPGTRNALKLAAFAATLFLGCRQEPAPEYLRLSGEAPRIEGLAPSATALVAFWESWCGPCQEEAPSLVRLADSGPAGLRVMVISRDSSPEALAQAFGTGSTSKVLTRSDPAGRLSEAFGVQRLPTSILVSDGRLVARFGGARDWSSAANRRLLDRLMAEREGGRRGTP